jgi:hypothetical protein
VADVKACACRAGAAGVPILSPSVWKRKGCLSYEKNLETPLVNDNKDASLVGNARALAVSCGHKNLIFVVVLCCPFEYALFYVWKPVSMQVPATYFACACHTWARAIKAVMV